MEASPAELHDFVCEMGRRDVSVTLLEQDVHPLTAAVFYASTEQRLEPAGKRRDPEPSDPWRLPWPRQRLAPRRESRSDGSWVVGDAGGSRWPKMCAQVRARVMVLACLVGAVLFVLVESVQSSTPGDTLLRRWIHESGFADSCWLLASQPSG